MFTVTLSIITKNWKQPQMSLNWRMDKQTVVHLHSGLLLSNKKGTTSTSNNMDESQMQMHMWKKQIKNATYFIIPVTWHSGKGKNHRDIKQISDCQGLKMEGGVDYRRTWENFWSNEIFLSFLIMVMVTDRFVFVRTLRTVH